MHPPFPCVKRENERQKRKVERKLLLSLILSQWMERGWHILLCESGKSERIEVVKEEESESWLFSIPGEKGENREKFPWCVLYSNVHSKKNVHSFSFFHTLAFDSLWTHMREGKNHRLENIKELQFESSFFSYSHSSLSLSPVLLLTTSNSN
jgi:hypothetical protein